MPLFRLAIVVLAAAALPAVAATNDKAAARLDAQRAAFTAAWQDIQAGKLSPASAQLHALENYPLYPYLRYAYVDRNLKTLPPATVAKFVTDYPQLPPTPALRYRWLRELAQNGEWTWFTNYYDGGDAPALVCASISAGLTGSDTAALSDAKRAPLIATAKRLWLSDRDQPRECDPVFKYLAAHKLITKDMIGERFAMALESHHLDLAAYLADRLSKGAQARAAHWQHMAADPGATLAAGGFSDSADDRALLVFGLERLAQQNAASAKASWADVKNRFHFDIHQRANVERQIALSEARQHLPDAYRDLTRIGASGYDLVKQWRVRTALWNGAWHSALARIADLPASRRASRQWRYWRARALAATGHDKEADAIYRKLAHETGYFGFLAADRLGVDYTFAHQASQPDPTVMADIDQRPGIVRAHELFEVGLLDFAEGEWRAATQNLSTAQRCQAGLLAADWNWHAAAIRTLSGGGCWDDLKLRYPIAYSDAIGAQAQNLNLDPAWLYGMVRSESLFAANAISRSGALGLMQLMPATGRQVAARLGLDLDGDGLLDPATNITIGSAYLDHVRGRFGDNACLATAAYNAGPNAVAQWLPDASMDADVWVANIPYRETRRYVRRVMAHTVIFDWRIGGTVKRITARMGEIAPPAAAPGSTATARTAAP